MIVTKSWLNEFVDLDGVTDAQLYETFNAIGLEVDSIRHIAIPSKVVVGKVLSCEKHPDADKLNVCQVDVGVAKRQIVCGAANVVDAEYVAVALIGAVLPEDFEIKFATLRGVDSEGMICSAGELGLPEVGEGIMVLDESIGELQVGRELGSYERVADTIIELELTANRGDCLSIHGVARDLSVALDRDMRPFDHQNDAREKVGIARLVSLQCKGEIDADLIYALARMDQLKLPFLYRLRLAMVDAEADGKLASFLAYATHATGVILRAYDAEKLKREERIELQIVSEERGIIAIRHGDETLGVVGVWQDAHCKADDNSGLLLFESSYIHPDLLVEAVAAKSYEKDELYYKTSRGSEPDLELGMAYLSWLLEGSSSCRCYEGTLNVTHSWEPVNITVDYEEISSLIGQRIEHGKIYTILKKLGFEIHSRQSDKLGVLVPRFRHDIKNVQDVAEEIVRIVGINNIEARPLELVEKNRINTTLRHYAFKKGLRQRAVATGLYETITYLFAERSKLERYDFELLPAELELANPIAEELNTLRSTLLVNLLDAVRRNVNYSVKSIGLFEIGAVFDRERRQKEVLACVFSGEKSAESVVNQGKPPSIDFAGFVAKLGAIIGDFTLQPCSVKNGLIHPYQSADIIYRGKNCGYISKLHPVAQEDFGIYDTFIAEIEMEALYPVHIDAKPISKFQGVYKDLSIVIANTLSYGDVDAVIGSIDLEILKRWYPVDIYEDESLGGKKSLTVRFFLQSMEGTLQEKEIESAMRRILQELEEKCQATLR
jgi:phenylalanyl-tRNA synthetase beta chain